MAHPFACHPFDQQTMVSFHSEHCPMIEHTISFSNACVHSLMSHLVIVHVLVFGAMSASVKSASNMHLLTHVVFGHGPCHLPMSMIHWADTW